MSNFIKGGLVLLVILVSLPTAAFGRCGEIKWPEEEPTPAPVEEPAPTSYEH